MRETLVLFVVMGIVAPVFAFAETDIDCLISKLDPLNAPSVRAQAARELSGRDTDPATLKAVERLKAGLKDSNDDVRYESLAALVLILAEHHQECPVELFELANDREPRIRTNFRHLVDVFDAYPPEGLKLCLLYYNNLSGDEKPDALNLIAKAGGKDQRVMQILFDAVNSRNARMRVNGTAALWTATRDFDFVLPLLFERIDDFEEVTERHAADSGRFTGRNAEISIRLCYAAIGGTFHWHLDEHRKPFIKALQQVAKVRDVQVRRRLSKYLSLCLGQAAEQRVDEKAKADSQSAVEYDAVRQLVNRLVADADESVARNAQAALKHLTTLERLTKNETPGPSPIR